MSTDAFIARQPIVDSKHQLMAYELLFRHSAHAQSAYIGSDVDAGITVISNTLFNMGTSGCSRASWLSSTWTGPC